MSTRVKTETVASAYLSLLASRGVEYLFGNAGTDFAPLIEAYGEAAQKGLLAPRPILATHENLAVTMAHGYGMVTRRLPAVMVHVSVGTANMVCAAMNCARENVAVLLSAGRTPLTEEGMLGSRDGYIHWAQEMYDQSGLLREIVKWEYELRNASQLETVVDRAVSVAMSEPRGPVYLSLPREILAERGPASLKSRTRVKPAAAPHPDAASIAAAAGMLEKAKKPLIVTCNAGRDTAAFEALSGFAERFAIPVIQHKPRYLSLPSSHPMHLGYEPKRLVAESDVILAIECDVPWMPVEAAPRESCKIIQCGIDPLYSHIPIRGFTSDVTIAGGAAASLEALSAALEGKSEKALIAARRKRAKENREAYVSECKSQLDMLRRRTPMHPAWMSHCVERAKDADTIVVNEYTLNLDHCGFDKPDTYFGSSAASGLGWGAGAALGAKLGAPDCTVIAVLGDGAYLFANPVAVHHAAAVHDLPVLFIVNNNAMWNAVRHFTVAMYPEGRTVKSNDQPFIRLDSLPAFEEVCRAAGGHGERVERPEDLPSAIERALHVVRHERRQALLNVMCAS